YVNREQTVKDVLAILAGDYDDHTEDEFMNIGGLDTLGQAASAAKPAEPSGQAPAGGPAPSQAAPPPVEATGQHDSQPSKTDAPTPPPAGPNQGQPANAPTAASQAVPSQPAIAGQAVTPPTVGPGAPTPDSLPVATPAALPSVQPSPNTGTASQPVSRI